MAYPVFDARRGTWSIRWHNGVKWTSQSVPGRPPAGWKRGDARPRTPPHVLEAQAEYARREEGWKIKAGERTAPVRVEDFLDARAAKVETLKPGTAKSMRTAHRPFIEYCETHDLLFMDLVTPAMCSEYIDHRLIGLAASTLAQNVAYLSAAWAAAVRVGIVAENPWTKIERPPVPVARKRGSWTPAELDQLLSASKRWLRNLLILGCNTGLRISALRTLTWGDVTFSVDGAAGLGIVAIRPENDKAAKGYVVPMNRRVFDLLRELRSAGAKGTDCVLMGMRGKPIVSNAITGVAIVRACRRAGLPHPESPNHHMRRTFGRQAVLGQLTGQPVPVYVVSKWFGHSSIKMTERYLDLKIDASHEWMKDVSE